MPYPNNPWGTIRVTTIPYDPNLKDFLPPELQAALEKELSIGGGSSNPSENNEVNTPKEKIKFDYKMVNCNQDLKTLTSKLKKSKITNYGMLLYGVSGAGKSYYGQWLAQEMKMPFIKKLASDLNGKYVGETEKNIRDAFKEAREKKAILLLDEADSFLCKRELAQQMYQVSAVNEVLVQMEDHPYPFIMTTNLKDKIDNAAMRRFIFKIKYDYMTEENIIAGVKTYFGKGFKLKPEQLAQLTNICSGDFKIAKVKLDILEGSKYTNDLIFEYLLKEQSEKNIIKPSNKIVF